MIVTFKQWVVVFLTKLQGWLGRKKKIELTRALSRNPLVNF